MRKTSFSQTIKATALLLFLFCAIGSSAQSTNSKYNKVLADSLGSDDYGMKQYTLVILKAGSATINDKAALDSIFHGHIKNIQRLASMGKLIVAGPLENNAKGYRGIFILNVKTEEEARVLLQTDPAVHAKVLDFELYGWYGSAALPMYLDYHQKVEKKSF
jgi:uncharacterized protein YciI